MTNNFSGWVSHPVKRASGEHWAVPTKNCTDSFPPKQEGYFHQSVNKMAIKHIGVKVRHKDKKGT
jgi:hypothetical protein